MGLETRCHARWGRRTSEGKAHLDHDRLTFRGDFRVSVPFQRVTHVSAADETLRLEGPDGVLALRLGRAAEQWARKIRMPRSRLDKLGVRADSVVTVLGLRDPEFTAELAARNSGVSSRLRRHTDLVFLGVARHREFDRLSRIRDAIAPAGAVWIVYRKGQPTLSRDDVMRAGQAVGLVDIKVVGFSDTHTALKFVIPVAQRSPT